MTPIEKLTKLKDKIYAWAVTKEMFGKEKDARNLYRLHNILEKIISELENS